jgi:hypothetical protein
MSIAADFQALPMGALIGIPLMAAVDADCAAALKSFQFLEEHLLEDDGSGGRRARTADFSFIKPYDKTDPQTGDVTIGEETTKLSVPLAVLAPPGTLRVKTCDIDFTMEVKTQEKDSSSTSASTTVSGKAGFGWWSASVKGSISHQREHTRSTDKTAKYEVKVHAEQQEMPEGLSRVLDILQQAVAPKEKTQA